MTTIAQLKKTLTEKQIAFKSKMRKAELITLLPPPPVEVVTSPLDILFASKVADKYEGRGINNYVYSRDGADISGFGSACYARLSYGPVTGLIIDISWHFDQMSAVMKEHYPEWITGMLRDSPFSVAFREKSFEEAMKSGIHLNVDTCSSSVCIAAAIALRGYHEFRRRFDAYYILRTLDIPFSMKWFLSIVLIKKALGWRVGEIGSNHCVIGSAVEERTLLTTLQEGLKENTAKPFSKINSGFHIFETVSGQHEMFITNFLTGLVPCDVHAKSVDVWTNIPVTENYYSDEAVVKLSQALLSPQQPKV